MSHYFNSSVPTCVKLTVTSTEFYVIPDYPCPDNSVCGLSVHDFKLLMTNDEGGT
jgi:hypothetical protein